MITKNKKGSIGLILLFAIILMVILFAGFMMVVGSSILNLVFDEVVPELSNLGMIENANMTQIADLTITPLNNVVQSLVWLTGVLYILMLIGSFLVVFISKSTPNKWLIGFYFALAILVLLTTVYISNMYEEFYTGTDDFALRLKEHGLLSWMILYSPTIFAFIIFLTGIVLFSGLGSEEEFV